MNEERKGSNASGVPCGGSDSSTSMPEMVAVACEAEADHCQTHADQGRSKVSVGQNGDCGLERGSKARSTVTKPNDAKSPRTAFLVPGMSTVLSDTERKSYAFLKRGVLSRKDSKAITTKALRWMSSRDREARAGISTVVWFTDDSCRCPYA